MKKKLRAMQAKKRNARLNDTRSCSDSQTPCRVRSKNNDASKIQCSTASSIDKSLIGASEQCSFAFYQMKNWASATRRRHLAATVQSRARSQARLALTYGHWNSKEVRAGQKSRQKEFPCGASAMSHACLKYAAVDGRLQDRVIRRAGPTAGAHHAC